MAWDTQETQRRLKEAAVAEFAERGPDGTTMARIAQRAGINKERLYNYFGDKRSLFEAVLTEQLEKLAAAVALHQPTYQDIGAFAGHTFDYHAAHPELARLLLWEGLAGGPPADEVNRTEHYQRKVRAIAQAQQRGDLDDTIPAPDLALLLIALAAWWSSVPQLAHMLTGADPSDPAERARRRETVVRAAERLASPRT